ncbi:SDR family NAD(P)-dependent oxidoreductase [Vibrio sp.]|uniref:SDR family NAD(P)-dependent oxidoreductase n=1 Tax=Vibrio sp. TaxID=678 RepID=UPI003D139071
MSVVMITGATSGIGKQLAMDYAREGWSVLACGRNAAALEELAGQSASSITPICFDVTDPAATHQALQHLPQLPDVWLLNAGDCEYINDGVIDAALFQRVFSVNVLGLVNVIEAIQQHFKSGQRIAIMGSVASEVALPRAEAYGASKAAVSYLARTLTLDLRHKGIDVTTIFPGFVQTPLTDKNDFAMPMLITAEQASKRIRNGLRKGLTTIYFPFRFTAILRLIGVLPYSWQTWLIGKMFNDQGESA